MYAKMKSMKATLIGTLLLIKNVITHYLPQTEDDLNPDHKENKY